MKILITGGAGFIGSHLAEALIGRGDEVCVLDNLSTGSLDNLNHLQPELGFEFICDSIFNERLMGRLIERSQVVVHLAAAVGVKLIVQQPVNTILTNVRGTEILLNLAANSKQKVLLASSSEVYGKNSKIPFTEDSDLVLGNTTKSRWSYACSKALDEFLALAYHKDYGLPVVIMRFFNTVGPRQTGAYGMVLPTFVSQALSGKPITVYGDGQQSRTFTYVQDVVQAIMGLIDTEAAVGQVFNVGGIGEITILELAQRVKRLTNSDSPIIKLSYDEAYQEGFEDMRRRVPDISKLNKLMGFKPRVNINTMIQLVAEYYLTHMRYYGKKQAAGISLSV